MVLAANLECGRADARPVSKRPSQPADGDDIVLASGINQCGWDLSPYGSKGPRHPDAISCGAKHPSDLFGLSFKLALHNRPAQLRGFSGIRDFASRRGIGDPEQRHVFDEKSRKLGFHRGGEVRSHFERGDTIRRSIQSHQDSADCERRSRLAHGRVPLSICRPSATRLWASSMRRASTR